MSVSDATSRTTPVRAPGARAEAASAAENSDVHTRILRCMLAVEDSAAYWRHADGAVPLALRAGVAFAERWFGMKSEARVRTLVVDMAARFDAFPQACALLHRLGNVPSSVRALVCHLHTQLADPIYRRFTGDFLPERREHGHATIDRGVVSRWVESSFPGRWSAITLTKFASNLLATAFDAGLIVGRREPRKLGVVHAPELVAGYTLYLLRDVRIQGTLTDNPYLRSLGITPSSFRTFAPRIPGIRYAELGSTADVAFTEPDLVTWGLRYLGGASA